MPSAASKKKKKRTKFNKRRGRKTSVTEDTRSYEVKIEVTDANYAALKFLHRQTEIKNITAREARSIYIELLGESVLLPEGAVSRPELDNRLWTRAREAIESRNPTALETKNSEAVTRARVISDFRTIVSVFRQQGDTKHRLKNFCRSFIWRDMDQKFAGNRWDPILNRVVYHGATSPRMRHSSDTITYKAVYDLQQVGALPFRLPVPELASVGPTFIGDLWHSVISSLSPWMKSSAKVRESYDEAMKMLNLFRYGTKEASESKAQEWARERGSKTKKGGGRTKTARAFTLLDGVYYKNEYAETCAGPGAELLRAYEKDQNIGHRRNMSRGMGKCPDSWKIRRSTIRGWDKIRHEFLALSAPTSDATDRILKKARESSRGRSRKDLCGEFFKWISDPNNSAAWPVVDNYVTRNELEAEVAFRDRPSALFTADRPTPDDLSNSSKTNSYEFAPFLGKKSEGGTFRFNSIVVRPWLAQGREFRLRLVRSRGFHVEAYDPATQAIVFSRHHRRRPDTVLRGVLGGCSFRFVVSHPNGQLRFDEVYAKFVVTRITRESPYDLDALAADRNWLEATALKTINSMNVAYYPKPANEWKDIKRRELRRIQALRPLPANPRALCVDLGIRAAASYVVMEVKPGLLPVELGDQGRTLDWTKRSSYVSAARDTNGDPIHGKLYLPGERVPKRVLKARDRADKEIQRLFDQLKTLSGTKDTDLREQLIAGLAEDISEWRKRTRGKRRRDYEGGLSQWSIVYHRNVHTIMKRVATISRDSTIRRHLNDTGGKLGGSLLAHCDKVRKQRIKRAASEITQLAMQHGCHVIFFENLHGFRCNEKNTRNLNKRLAQWSHLGIIREATKRAEIEGIVVAEIAADYTSRFDARTGAPGIRAWHRSKCPYVPNKRNIKGDFVFDRGGPLFLSITPRGTLAVLDADINAAYNVGYRAFTRYADLYRLPVKRSKDGMYKLGSKKAGATKQVQGFLDGAEEPESGLGKRVAAAIRREMNVDPREIELVWMGDAFQMNNSAPADNPPELVGNAMFRDPSGAFFSPSKWFGQRVFWGRVESRIRGVLNKLSQKSQTLPLDKGVYTTVHQ